MKRRHRLVWLRHGQLSVQTSLVVYRNCGLAPDWIWRPVPNRPSICRYAPEWTSPKHVARIANLCRKFNGDYREHVTSATLPRLQPKEWLRSHRAAALKE